MSRYTIDLSGELEYKLLNFMKENKIKLRSSGIKTCIDIATKDVGVENALRKIDDQLNRIYHTEYMIKKILEYLFVNMEFEKNLDIDSDKCLKQIYDEEKLKYF